jgi:hypothetical protein
MNKTAWLTIKETLNHCSQRDLLHLIQELYHFSPDNKRFLTARFVREANMDSLTEYKKIIQHNVCPEPPKPLRLAVARKAVSDYKKAIGDTVGVLELSLYYVEQGAKFTDLYGDINEPFYMSVESMFQSAMKLLASMSPDSQQSFFPRIRQIMKIASKTGWGFEEQLRAYFEEFFPDRGSP